MRAWRRSPASSAPCACRSRSTWPSPGPSPLWALVEAVAVDGPGTPAVRILVALPYAVPLLWRRRFPIPVLALICAVLAAAGRDRRHPGLRRHAVPGDAHRDVLGRLPCAPARRRRCRPCRCRWRRCSPRSNTDYWSGGSNPGDIAILSFFVAAAWGAGRVVRVRSTSWRRRPGRERRAGPRGRRPGARPHRPRAPRRGRPLRVDHRRPGGRRRGVRRPRPGPRPRAHRRGAPDGGGDARREMRRLLDVLREDEALYTPSPRLARPRRLVDEVARHRRARRADRGGRRRRPARRHRPGGVPDRPGGAHQRAPPRRRRARPGCTCAGSTARSRWRWSTTRRPQPGEGPGGGHGLVGMRERVRLYGGVARRGRRARTAASRCAPACRWQEPGDPDRPGRRPRARPRRPARDARAHEDDIEVVGRGRRRRARPSSSPCALRPDVVLMDIRMPVLDGIEATRRLARARPGAAVLVLTTFDLDEYVYEALRAGAGGFLLKDASPGPAGRGRAHRRRRRGAARARRHPPPGRALRAPPAARRGRRRRRSRELTERERRGARPDRPRACRTRRSPRACT